MQLPFLGDVLFCTNKLFYFKKGLKRILYKKRITVTDIHFLYP